MNEIDKLPLEEHTITDSQEWIQKTSALEFNSNFHWMGRPIMQFPQDIMALQEIIWNTQPSVIVETGVAQGGSAIFYASMLELLGGDRSVVAVDIEITLANREAIENHPFGHRVELVEGSSIDPSTVSRVHELTDGKGPVMVVLDSHHTQEHVLKELRLYSPLVTKGNYLVVFDTVIEDMPDAFSADRPWKRGNSPKTAVREFLRENDRFRTDHSVDAKLHLSFAPEGYLRCVED